MLIAKSGTSIGIELRLVDKATRLIDYLTRLASLRSKTIRDIDEYEKKLWLSEVPRQQGCFTQAWGRDQEHESDEWLEVQNRREPELPIVPAACKNWVSLATLHSKNDLPELLRGEIEVPKAKAVVEEESS